VALSTLNSSSLQAPKKKAKATATAAVPRRAYKPAFKSAVRKMRRLHAARAAKARAEAEIDSILQSMGDLCEDESSDDQNSYASPVARKKTKKTRAAEPPPPASHLRPHTRNPTSLFLT
jgi:hypothetical protein